MAGAVDKVLDLYLCKRILAFLVLLGVFVVLDGNMAEAKRRAFVVGIDKYDNVPQLQSPQNDARAVANELIDLQFNVTLVTDDEADRKTFYDIWSAFLDVVDANDDVVVYYSGHGVSSGGVNFLLPRDTPTVDNNTTVSSIEPNLILLDNLIEDLKAKRVNTTVWVLDACRDNPFKKTGIKSIGQNNGLTVTVDGGGEMFIFYAAKYGETALDRIQTDPLNTATHSLFTRRLLDYLDTSPKLEAASLAKKIRTDVVKLSNKGQIPAYYDGLVDEWCFDSCAEEKPTKIALDTVKRSIVLKDVVGTGQLAPAQNEIKKAFADNVATISKDLQLQNAPLESWFDNVAFVGRKSVASDCKPEPYASDRYPFGCTVLKAAMGGTSQPYIGVKIKPLTEVNIRKRLPVKNDQGSSISCIVGTIKSGGETSFSSIVAIEKNDDVYYWGTVAGANKDCLANN